MPLTQQQLNALPTLEWMFGGEGSVRRSGRTLAIAVAAIRQACSVPHSNVYVFDHYCNDRSNRAQEHVMDIIQRLVRGDRRISSALRVSHGTFRIEIYEPIDNWLPTEESLGSYPGPIQATPTEPVKPPPPTAWERLSQDE